MIELRYNNGDGNVSRVIHESESSYRYRSLMNKTSLQLKFSLPEYIEFPVGTTCEFQNETFTLLAPPTIKKNGERDIEFTLDMGNDEEHLSRYKLRNNEDGRLKWSMTAKPEEFIRQIVLNLNRRDGEGVWSVGTCLEATEKTIEFNHSYLLDALQTIADEFETEWEIVDHTISLHKVEYFKDSPVALSYGKGNGFVSGLGRSSSTDTPPVEILYVQGGEQNIDASKYGSRFLLLPKAQELVYEGKRYVASSDGLSVQRADKEPRYHNEDSVELEDIYPKRVGSVTAVEVESEEKNFYDIIDAEIPENLDYNNYIIEGEDMTFIFQSGMLAGREFEVKYKHKERRFQLVPQEFDGIMMPSKTFAPQVGDTYAIFGIMLPDEYICDNENKQGASWEMFREACRYLHENEEQKFTFTGTLQGLWAKKNWLAVGGKLKVGGYVHFSDNQFAPDGVDIRIVGIKDFLYNPYSPTIELSNDPSGGSSMSSTLNKISRQEVVIEENRRDVVQYTKRRFNDVKETLSMLEAAVGGYTDSISPIAVKTMSMLVGDESLQFTFGGVEYVQEDGGGAGLADGSGEYVEIVGNEFSSCVWERLNEGETYEVVATANEGDKVDLYLVFADSSFRVISNQKIALTIGSNGSASKIIKVPAGADRLYVSNDNTCRFDVYRYYSVDFYPEYNSGDKTLSCPKRRLTHMTLGNKDISGGERNLADCPQWEIGEYVSPTLTDESAKYYLYARCSKSNTQGIYLLSEDAIGMEEVDGFYHFLVGILNSESGGIRSFVTLYGFTEILPSRVTTERIVSSDGKSFLDLKGNAMHLGGDESFLDWNKETEGALTMSNATIRESLKVDGEALLAGFKVTDTILKSELDTIITDDFGREEERFPAFLLDGKNGQIEMRSAKSGGQNSLDRLFLGNGSTIVLDSESGIVEARNDKGVAYVSASGIFCNNPRTGGTPASTGRTHNASIVGLGYGNGVNNSWSFDSEGTIVAGVYGYGSNTGTAHAFGGYFNNLKANGLILGLKYVSDSSSSSSSYLQIGEGVAQVIGLINQDNTGYVYLPSDGIEGRVIWVKEVGKGSLRVYPSGGQRLFNGVGNELDYISVNNLREYKFVFTKFALNNENVEAWIMTSING